MLNMKSMFSRTFAALVLAASSVAAFASPVYHVTIDTTTLGTGSAFLDLALGTLGDATPVTATLSGFKGDFVDVADRLGDSTGSVAEGTIVLGNSESWNDVYYAVKLGGKFDFNISFLTGADDTTIGTRFSAALYDAIGYLGLEGDLVQIDLMPGGADVLSDPNAYGQVGIAAAANVPEPSAAALVLIGLMMAGAVARRRS
jgi:hypothetical protein